MRSIEEMLNNKQIWDHEEIFRMHSAWVKLPDCGTCSVVWNVDKGGYEHVSVSPKHKFKIPTWNDMCVLKDMFFNDEEEEYQIHPKKVSMSTWLIIACIFGSQMVMNLEN